MSDAAVRDDDQLAARVRSAAEELNARISEAADAGLRCEVEVVEVQAIGRPGREIVTVYVARPL